jgi:hypothetical protein
MGDVRARPDGTWIFWATGEVSGTDAGAGVPRNMTGTLLEASNLNAVVTYPSGAVASLNNIVLPSGSFLITLPNGQSPGSPRDDRFSQTGFWTVSMECSGTDSKMNALNTINNYRVLPIGHVTNSGTYAFTFQRLSGSANAQSGFTLDSDPSFTSASFESEVPQDLANPSSMACRWSVMIVGRKTTRRQ